MPSPKIDPMDENLARAFEDLAEIGKPESTSPAEPPVITSDEPAAETMAPRPLSEPKPIASPVPVAVVPSSATDPQSTAAAADNQSKSSPQAIGNGDALEELAGQAAARTANEPRQNYRTGTRGQKSKPGIWIVICGLCLVTGIAIGFGLGSVAGPATDDTETGKNITDGETDIEEDHAVAIAVEGRITYRDESGQSKPDSGARIIVFPAERKGELKLPATGFRSGDSTDDFAIGQAALHAMGASAAVANDEGRFELPLKAAGEYQILVLSRFAQQPDDAPVDTDMQKELAKHFQRPAELLGKVAHTFGQLRYNGESITTWDHSFASAQ